MSKSVIIGAGIAFLITILTGGYFLTRESELDDLMARKNKLESNLITAEDKFNRAKGALSTMLGDLQNSFALGTSVQDQIKQASDIVKQTDFIFTDPDGSNPEIIVDNPLPDILINAERQYINLLLAEWLAKTDILSIKEIGVSEAEKIKADTEIIKTFIENLAKIVASLTPEDSELSQFQIDTYFSQLPSIVDINEVLTSLETAIENHNSQVESSQTSSNFPPPTSIEPEEVVAQQAVVTQAQTEVTTVQEQLAEIEEEIEPLSPTPVPISPITNPDPENQTENQNTESSENNPISLPPRVIDSNQGIIIQPGPVRLIQGTDPF
ncbi:hypothetical protein A3C67_02915 [Candidatus Nomurabacteria bacterium RIFCSPHIGHO2_02_FULL_42_19]|uniref:Uncharacterized protein n=1 Tax=Candidatus Nomurabacteria bacterium RIFCSPHIGHO2_02_FULL_42_19 TaxID=1801756 RepID=A0A1F6W1J1_9BACT|nr:MAG: hypothetical protein A3C67_02915 [Candidatus Nomurabacteria bacterium RIFCSPHIGHO2_02_FULL_42_19]